MSHRSTALVRLWFVTVLFGLNALLVAGVSQDGVILRAAADQLSLQDDTPAYAAIPGTEALVPTHVRHVSHALLRTSASALLSQAASIAVPAFTGDLTVRENVLALGNAARRTGPSRAPPVA